MAPLIAGEALFPEHKSLSFLLRERRRTLTQASWQSEYQQNPIIVGGDIFPIDKLQVLAFWGGNHSQVRALRGQGRHRRRRLLHSRRADAQDGERHVCHRARSARAVERAGARAAHSYWAEQDRRQLRGDYEIGVEQELRSGGKESAEATIGCWRAIAATLTGLLEARRYVRSLSPRRCRAATCASSPETGTTPSWTSASRSERQVQGSGGRGVEGVRRLTSKPAYNLDAMA